MFNQGVVIEKSIKRFLYFKLLKYLGVSDVNSWRETFRDQQYKWLYNKIKPNTLVLDIGAGIGDTAIYFAMNINVDGIWSYEPEEELIAKAEANLKKAGFYDKVLLCKEKLKELPKLDNYYTAIKCDVEGDEYSIFNENVDLSRVYAIQIEYHYGVKELEELLKSKGFTVTYTEPKETTEGFLMGFLYAVKL